MTFLGNVKFSVKINTNYYLLQRLFGTAMSIGWVTKKIVPDMLTEVPPRRLSVQYAKVVINEGNFTRPKLVREIPHLGWMPYAEGIYHTISLTDLDVPSKADPCQREFLHWLIVNIPGNEIEKGDVVYEYIGAGPSKDTGFHRYVFLLYQQNNKVEFKEKKHTNKSARGRGKFSSVQFANKYKIGKPIAGNFFEAQWDESVPELHKELHIANGKNV